VGRAAIRHRSRCRGLQAVTSAQGKPELVVTPAQLQRTVESVRRSARVGIDTEFSDFPALRPRLDLFQIATDEEEFLVDPQAFGKGAALVPLFLAVCESPVVIAHAPMTDFAIIHQYAQRFPSNPFCTQVAADIVGLGDSIGLGNLIEKVVGVRLAKTQSGSDWGHRPLSEAQLEYAVEDVRYLLPLHDYLTKQLQHANRLEWFEAEMQAMCSSEVSKQLAFPLGPLDEAWMKVRGAHKLDSKGLAVLSALAEWRAKKSIDRNRQTVLIARDDALMSLAMGCPRDSNELASYRLPKNLERETADLLAAIKYGEYMSTLNDKKGTPLRHPQAQNEGGKPDPALWDLLGAALYSLAARNNVSPRLVASRKELRLMANPALSEEELRASGIKVLQEGNWRCDLVGKALLQVRAGTTVLGVKDGQVACMDVAWQT